MAITSINGEGGHVVRRVHFKPNEPGQVFVAERDGEYLIRWEGYSAAEDTWEPAAQFEGGTLEAAWPLLYFVVLLAIMWLWAPSKNAVRYAYSEELALDSEDEDYIDGLEMGEAEGDIHQSPAGGPGAAPLSQ